MVNVEDGHEAQSGDKEYSYKTITNPIFDDFLWSNVFENYF